MSRSLIPLRVAAVLSAAALLVTSVPAWAEDTDPPRITHVRVERAPISQSLVIRAKIDDASEIFQPSLYFRVGADAEFTSTEMKSRGDAFEAVIPAEQVIEGLEYFIEAFDENGNGPAREGAPEAAIVVSVFDPSTMPPPPPDGDPITSVQTPPDDDDSGVLGTWWFWTIIGAAAVGGGIAAAVALSGGSPTQVDVMISGPDPAGALR